MSDDERTRMHLNDLCTVLGRSLDTLVLPHRAPSPAALASAIQAGRVQIAWLSPTLMVTSAALSSVIPLVSAVREGLTSYHTVLFVSESSPVTAPEELRGARAAWVAQSSAGGYLFARMALVRRGLDPQKLFLSETFHDTYGRAVAAVLEGRADVGATFAVFEGGDPSKELLRVGYRDVVPGRTGRVIDVAGPIPADLIAAVPSVPILTRSALAIALQRIAEDPAAKEPMRALFNAETFRQFSAASLPKLRVLVEMARRHQEAPVMKQTQGQ